jgi:hypothetical protein
MHGTKIKKNIELIYLETSKYGKEITKIMSYIILIAK